MSSTIAPTLPATMRGVFLPGNSTAEVRNYPVPTPGPGQLLIRMGASGICGSDIGFIYHQYKTHKGLDGKAAYHGVISGHEPCGQVVAAGPNCLRFGVGDKVIIYHIVGCGRCTNCRAGYFISCLDAAHREAYGWQRDGGNADYVLVEESTCIPLLGPLTYADGCLIACGFGTAYEGLRRTAVRGSDDLLVVGLGPVGLAAAMIGRLLGARRVIGVERNAQRMEVVGALGLVDDIVPAGPDAVPAVLDLTGGRGCDVALDASGSAPGRSTAIEGAAEWGRVSLLGEGGRLETEVSDLMLHKYLTVYATWVTSLGAMEQLTRLLAEANVHPEVIVSHRLPISEADKAYALAASGTAGKVILVPDEGAVPCP